MPQQRLPFVQTSPRRDSSISDEYSEISAHGCMIQMRPKPLNANHEDIETKYYNQRTGKKNGAANTVTKRIAVPVELRPQPSTLRILLLTVTASQKARHELPKSRIYELFSR
ncbi:hypothetical protein HRG_014314 [Hirsutella rhossiliensis]